MIEQDLKACFPADYLKILSLANYLVCESDGPIYRFGHWAHTHWYPYGKPLSSQRISDLFAGIDHQACMRFFSKQRQRYGESEYLAYDTTSISSYSELIRHVRYGKNKNSEPLPQINLALVFGQSSMMPVYYRRLPGNVTDVTTVRKLLCDLGQMDFGRVKLVLDRGFYSTRNINALYENRCKFIIAARKNTRFVRQHLERCREQVTDFTCYDSDLELHYKTITARWPYQEYDNQSSVVASGERRVYVHIYYNGEQVESEKASFFRQLSQVKQALLEGGCSEQQQAMADWLA